MRELAGHSFPKPGTSTLMVVGITSSTLTSPNRAVRLEQVDEKTGEGGNCSRWNRAEAVAAPKGEVEYHVFKVPPGAYARGGNSEALSAGTAGNAFLVPDGSVTYIGDFVVQPDKPKDALLGGSDFIFRRDIARAKTKLPKLAPELRMAEIITVPSVPRVFMCTP